MDGFNFSRKLFHWLGFFVPALLYFNLFEGLFGLQYASRALLFCLIGLILLGLGTVEIVRLNVPAVNNFYISIFGNIMKEAEKQRMNGVIPYMLSNAFIVAFFPPQIIFLSMSFLLVGDPTAAFFGSKYGKYRFYNGKSFIGVFAFFVASILSGLLLMGIFQATYGESPFSFYKQSGFNFVALVIISIGALSAALAEFFSGHALAGLLEDNLLIPVVSAIFLGLFSGLFGEIPSSEIIFPIQNLFTMSASPQ